MTHIFKRTDIFWVTSLKFDDAVKGLSDEDQRLEGAISPLCHDVKGLGG